jgi:WD40 repeat protein
LADDLLEQIAEPYRRTPWHVHKNRVGGNLFTLPGHTDQVMSLAIAPGGEVLASGGGDGTIRFGTCGPDSSYARCVGILG